MGCCFNKERNPSSERSSLLQPSLHDGLTVTEQVRQQAAALAQHVCLDQEEAPGDEEQPSGPNRVWTKTTASGNSTTWRERDPKPAGAHEEEEEAILIPANIDTDAGVLPSAGPSTRPSARPGARPSCEPAPYMEVLTQSPARQRILESAKIRTLWFLPAESPAAKVTVSDRLQPVGGSQHKHTDEDGDEACVVTTLCRGVERRTQSFYSICSIDVDDLEHDQPPKTAGATQCLPAAALPCTTEQVASILSPPPVVSSSTDGHQLEEFANNLCESLLTTCAAEEKNVSEDMKLTGPCSDHILAERVTGATEETVGGVQDPESDHRASGHSPASADLEPQSLQNEARTWTEGSSLPCSDQSAPDGTESPALGCEQVDTCKEERDSCDVKTEGDRAKAVPQKKSKGIWADVTEGSGFTPESGNNAITQVIPSISIVAHQTPAGLLEETSSESQGDTGEPTNCLCQPRLSCDEKQLAETDVLMLLEEQPAPDGDFRPEAPHVCCSQGNRSLFESITVDPDQVDIHASTPSYEIHLLSGKPPLAAEEGEREGGMREMVSELLGDDADSSVCRLHPRAWIKLGLEDECRGWATCQDKSQAGTEGEEMPACVSDLQASMALLGAYPYSTVMPHGLCVWDWHTHCTRSVSVQHVQSICR